MKSAAMARSMYRSSLFAIYFGEHGGPIGWRDENPRMKRYATKQMRGK